MMSVCRRQLTGKQDGVTLLELIVAMAVSGLLLVGMWRIFHGSIRFYRRGVQDVRSTMAARTVFGIMTRDLQKAFAAAQPHGIQGTDSRRTPPVDAVELTLMAATRMAAAAPAAEVRWQRIRYALQAGSSDGAPILARTFTTADGETRERVMPLSERLASFDLRYFDGRQWSDAWQQAPLPHAVEITAVFRNPGQGARTHRFTTVVTAP
jgi:type II secretion system protein J